MTPEQRRAEIDRKFPFHVDVPFYDDWDGAQRRMDFLITHVGTFDMYLVMEEGRSSVRHCFAVATDAELFKAQFKQEKRSVSASLSLERARNAEDEQRDIDIRFPFNVDLPHVVDRREAQRLEHYIISHVGRFATYEAAENGRVRSRYCFMTFEEAEMFRWGLAGKATRRSTRR
jgi:hypothetical protein